MQYVIFIADGRWIEQSMRSARWRAKQMLRQGQADKVDIYRLTVQDGNERLDLVAREISLEAAERRMA